MKKSAFFKKKIIHCVYMCVDNHPLQFKSCEEVPVLSYLPLFPGISRPFIFCICVCLPRLCRLGRAGLLLAPAPTFTHLQLIFQLPPSAAAVDKQGSVSGSRLSKNHKLFGPEMRENGLFPFQYPTPIGCFIIP